jgi:hypothetical protein
VTPPSVPPEQSPQADSELPEESGGVLVGPRSDAVVVVDVGVEVVAGLVVAAVNLDRFAGSVTHARL